MEKYEIKIIPRVWRNETHLYLERYKSSPRNLRTRSNLENVASILQKSGLENITSTSWGQTHYWGTLLNVNGGDQHTRGLARAAASKPRGPLPRRNIPLSPRTAVTGALLPSHLHVPQELEDLHGAVHDVLNRLLPDPAERCGVNLPGRLLGLGPGEGPGRHP